MFLSFAVVLLFIPWTFFGTLWLEQSPALKEALASWLSTFRSDWVSNETTQQLHAHISQREVHGLCQTLVLKKQKLKTSKEEVGAHSLPSAQ